MESLATRNPSVVPANVYVLLRVSEILSSVKVAAYIDPWTRSQEDQLDFVALGGYTVTL
jgi:hypothetical protein